MNDNERIYSFLKNHLLAVIATNFGKKSPESALIAYAEDENLCIYFQTGKFTRKAKNLSSNPNISLVVGFELDELATLQYEGTAELLTDDVETEKVRKLFADKELSDNPRILGTPRCNII